MMRLCVAMDGHSGPEEASQESRTAWNAPHLRVLPAALAEADQGGIHFDGLGFVS